MRSRTARCSAIPPVRPGLLLAALAVLAAAGRPATTSADTARIVPVDPTQHEGPTRASIVVTAIDGGVTALGPYRFRAEPTALRRSPDGRFFAVLVGDWSTDDRGLTIVPTDGRPAFEVPTRTRRGGPYDTEPENFSWTSDSQELVLGNTDAEIGPAAKVVLRCSVARRRCSAIPGVDGFAATVPGGIVASTSFHTMVVETSDFAPGDSEPADADTLQVLRTRWRARTALVGSAPRTLSVRRASLLDGVRGAVGVVGGPSGALITERRYRLRLAKHRGRRVVRLRSHAQRWVLVRSDGRIRTVVAPRLTVPKAHSAPLGNAEYFAGRIKTQRAVARPRAARATAGWLAVTGSDRGRGHRGPGPDRRHAGRAGRVRPDRRPDRVGDRAGADRGRSLPNPRHPVARRRRPRSRDRRRDRDAGLARGSAPEGRPTSRRAGGPQRRHRDERGELRGAHRHRPRPARRPHGTHRRKPRARAGGVVIRRALLARSIVVPRPRTPRTDPVLRPPRIALFAGAVVCSGLVAAPATAPADTARLEPIARIVPGELPRDDDHRIVVTDRHGAQRTLGPVPSGRLFAEPGGRYLLVVPHQSDGEVASPRIVPLDGSAPRTLRLPRGTMLMDDVSRVSWTPDGTEMLVGDALAWRPSAFTRPSTTKDLGRSRWTALRCPIATAVCRELPKGSGFAVGVPDGVLTTDSVFSSYPPPWWFDHLDEGDRPEWERPTSRRGRMWVRVANDARVMRTQLVGSAPKTLDGARRTGAAGLPVALAAVGGSNGAAISRMTFVSTLDRRRGKVRLKWRTYRPRILLARPGAPIRAITSRPIALPRGDRSRIHASSADDDEPLRFHPRFATRDGWVGGGSADSLVPLFAVLATMDTAGHVRPVKVGGRPATAWNLLRAALSRSPGRVAGAIEIVGYEAAGNAIVTAEHGFGIEGIPKRFSTLRVPLDGTSRPTIIRDRVDAAW